MEPKDIGSIDNTSENMTHHSEGKHRHSSHHHSSHHHGSHHHSSHHHHHHKSKKSKINKYIKKHIKAVKACSILLAFILVVLVALWADRGFSFKRENSVGGTSTSVIKEEQVYIGLPRFKQAVSLSDGVVSNYFDSDIKTTLFEIMKANKKKQAHRLDKGVPIDMSFDIFHLPDAQIVKNAKLKIFEKNNKKTISNYELDDNYTVRIYNLKTDTEYSYNLEIILSDESVFEYSGGFKTAGGPRFINIEGAQNVRDIGGWQTTDGRTVKQGLLYRGTELDGAVEKSYKITEQGISDMVIGLGVKTDMDLRFKSDGADFDALGSNVNHKYYATGMYAQVFEDNWKESMRQVFSDLAKPSNYPVYMHCTYGCDRTGTACYILEALLGVSEDDLIREFELSTLQNDGIKRDNILIVYNNLQSYSGNTIKQKAENYLLSIGVTPTEISSIRNIFLG